MSLTTAQKDEIHHKANGTGGQTKQSGASLAQEYGVSASAISNIKNHYNPQVASIEVKEKRPIIVYSPKFSGKRFEVESTTFGALIDEIGEDSAVEGVLGKGNDRATLSDWDEEIPFVEGQVLAIVLVPANNDGGGANN